jgi:hypothetical protein
MRTKIVLAPWLAALTVGAAVGLASGVAADTDPDVPYGGDAFDPSSQSHYPDGEIPFDGPAAGMPVPDPSPGSFGEHTNDHDEVDDSGGDIDVGF